MWPVVSRLGVQSTRGRPGWFSTEISRRGVTRSGVHFNRSPSNPRVHSGQLHTIYCATRLWLHINIRAVTADLGISSTARKPTV